MNIKKFTLGVIAVLTAGCKKLYDWTDEELSTEGKWISEWFKSE